MYVVVRTPSDEAELVVRASGSNLLLSDLLGRVTGQPAPPVVAIDGRPVATSTRFATSGVVAGSVLSLLDPAPAPAADGGEIVAVTLAQMAGTGAGTRVDLGAGEYRIGPGRRVAAPELDFAPVDESAIHLTVLEEGTVLVSGAARGAWIDGEPYERGTMHPWTSGFVEVDDRVFALRARPTDDGRPSGIRTVSAEGTSPFNRPPRRRPGPGSDIEPDIDPYPDLDDVLRMTTLDNRELWQRRGSDADALHIPIGLAPRPEADDRRLRSLTVDLQLERGVGIVGDSDFARAATRGLLLQATAAFGPADLDIAVITSAARLPAWEWVKWLPHATVVDDPQMMSGEADLRAWLRWRNPAARADALPAAHHTLVVVDEPAHWHDRGSALREWLSAGHDSTGPVRYVVLGGSPEEIPAICTTVLEERRGRGSVLELFSENVRVADVHPFLVPERIAIDAARRLASLEDPELPETDRLPREVSLERLLGLDRPDAGALAGRWIAARGERAPSARIGLALDGGTESGGVVELELPDGGLELIVTGEPQSGTGTFLESLLLGMAIERQPDDLNLLLFDLTGRGTFTAVADLPHTVGVWVDPDPAELRRCLRCLDAELTFRRRPGSAPHPHLVIAVDEAAPEQPGRSEFVARLLRIVDEGAPDGLHLVTASHRVAALDPSVVGAARRSLLLRSEGTDDVEQALLPRFVPGRGILRSPEGVTHLQTPNGFGTAPGAGSPHAIAPFVIGREPGAMERRLVRLNEIAPDRSDDPHLAAVVETLAETASELGQGEQRRPCPEPLPGAVGLHALLERFPGDGVPYALEDLPDEQRTAPLWWQPGSSGGVAVIGGDPGERTAVLLSLSLGIAARSSADDVHLYVVADLHDGASDGHDGASDGHDGASDEDEVADVPACAALRALPHTAAVIGLDEGDRLDALVQYLDDEITRRADLAEQWGGTERVVSGEPAIVVLIDDVGELRDRLRRRADGDGILADLERTIRDGGPFGVCALVTAATRQVLPRRTPDTLDLLLLQPEDPSELVPFGLDGADFTAAVAGRALRPAGPSEVQLAAPPHDIAGAIADLAAEPALERPPRPIPGAGSGGTASGGVDDASR